MLPAVCQPVLVAPDQGGHLGFKVFGIGLMRKNDAGQELSAGPDRSEPKAGMGVVSDLRPWRCVSEMSVGPLPALEMDVLAPLPAVRRAVSQVLGQDSDRFNIQRAALPERCQSLEAVTVYLLDSRRRREKCRAE